MQSNILHNYSNYLPNHILDEIFLSIDSLDDFISFKLVNKNNYSYVNNQSNNGQLLQIIKKNSMQKIIGCDKCKFSNHAKLKYVKQILSVSCRYCQDDIHSCFCIYCQVHVECIKHCQFVSMRDKCISSASESI